MWNSSITCLQSALLLATLRMYTHTYLVYTVYTVTSRRCCFIFVSRYFLPLPANESSTMSVGKSAPDIAVHIHETRSRKRSLALPLSVLSPETLSEAYYIGKKTKNKTNLTLLQCNTSQNLASNKGKTVVVWYFYALNVLIVLIFESLYPCLLLRGQGGSCEVLFVPTLCSHSSCLFGYALVHL